MRTQKRIAALLLALALLVSGLPTWALSAQALDTEPQEQPVSQTDEEVIADEPVTSEEPAQPAEEPAAPAEEEPLPTEAPTEAPDAEVPVVETIPVIEEDTQSASEEAAMEQAAEASAYLPGLESAPGSNYLDLGHSQALRDKLVPPMTFNLGDNKLYDTEPNDTPQTAQRLWDDRTISGVTVNKDMDFYVFTLRQRSLVEVTAVSDNPNYAYNIWYGLDPEDCYSDFVDVSYDSSSGLYFFECSIVLQAGDYYLGMSTTDGTQGDYLVYFNYNPVLEKPYKIANVIQGVRLYWKAYDTGNTYGVWRSENGRDGDYEWIADTKSTNYLDTTAVSGKTYFYRVAMIDWHISDSETQYYGVLSDPYGITFVDTPDITLRVNRASGVGLGWEKIPAATGYAIYRKSYSGTDSWVRIKTIQGADVTTWDDTSVKANNGSVYRYTVRALYGTTLSGCHNNGRTMARLTSSTLNTPSKVDSTTCRFTWSGNSQSSGYELRFMVGSTVVDTLVFGNPNTVSVRVGNITPGVQYKVQVRSYKKVSGVGTFYSAWSTAKYVTL